MKVLQTTNKEAAESSEAIRKKEVEERLKVLKEQKHNLVQVLKQVNFGFYYFSHLVGYCD